MGNIVKNSNFVLSHAVKTETISASLSSMLLPEEATLPLTMLSNSNTNNIVYPASNNLIKIPKAGYNSSKQFHIPMEIFCEIKENNWQCNIRRKGELL